MDIIFSPDRIGVNQLNALQEDAVRHEKSEQDVVLLAPTGSGKTLAYALLIKNFLQNTEHTQVLVIVPTRELAQQIETNFKALFPTLFCTSVHGGTASAIEKRKLTEHPTVEIGRAHV